MWLPGRAVGFWRVKARLGFAWLWETEHWPCMTVPETPNAQTGPSAVAARLRVPAGTFPAGDVSMVGSSSVWDGRARSRGAEGAAIARTATGTRSLLTLQIPNHLTLASSQRPSLLSLLHSQGAGSSPGPGCPHEGVSDGHLPPSCCSRVPLMPPSWGSTSTNTGQTPRPSACRKLPLLPLTSPFNAHRGAEPGATSSRRSPQGGFPFSPAPFASPASLRGLGKKPGASPVAYGASVAPRPLARPALPQLGSP